jgi:hypothetical protein
MLNFEHSAFRGGFLLSPNTVNESGYGVLTEEQRSLKVKGLKQNHLRTSNIQKFYMKTI